MKIRYNAPVVLTYTFLCIGVLFASAYTDGELIREYFTIHPGVQLEQPIYYWQLVAFIAGHADVSHLAGNISLILLLGPMLEEKYGSVTLLQMILLTALITGLLNSALFSSGLLGASGIVFMMILLSSFSNFHKGEIPLTFVLVALVYLGSEIIESLDVDNISQFAHILGGLCGAFFGFLRIKVGRREI